VEPPNRQLLQDNGMAVWLDCPVCSREAACGERFKSTSGAGSGQVQGALRYPARGILPRRYPRRHRKRRSGKSRSKRFCGDPLSPIAWAFEPAFVGGSGELSEGRISSCGRFSSGLPASAGSPAVPGGFRKCRGVRRCGQCPAKTRSTRATTKVSAQTGARDLPGGAGGGRIRQKRWPTAWSG